MNRAIPAAASSISAQDQLLPQRTRRTQRKNKTRKSKIGLKSGVIDRQSLSAQFNLGDHSPMNAFNSSLFSLLPFLRVLCVLRGESWFFGMQRFRSPANAVG